MNGAVRYWVGGVIAAVGIVCWSIGLAVFEPAVHRANDLELADWKAGIFEHLGADASVQMLLWAKDLRWAAMVLAIGGLLIVAAGTVRALVLLGSLVWAGVDILLDRANISGWPAAATAAGAVGAVALAVVWAARPTIEREKQLPPKKYILLYSGVAATVAPLLFYVESSNMQYWPSGMLAMAVILSFCLAITAVLAAATSVSAIRPRHLVGGPLLAGAAVAPVVDVLALAAIGEIDLLTSNRNQLVAWSVMPIVTLMVCLGLVWGRLTIKGWLGFGLGSIALSGVSFVLILFAIVVSYLVQDTVISLSGDTPYLDGRLMAAAGAMAGILLGIYVFVISAQRKEAAA